MNGFSVVFPFVSCMQIAGWSTWTYKHVRQNICLVLCATVWQNLTGKVWRFGWVWTMMEDKSWLCWWYVKCCRIHWHNFSHRNFQFSCIRMDLALHISARVRQCKSSITPSIYMALLQQNIDVMLWQSNHWNILNELNSSVWPRPQQKPLFQIFYKSFRDGNGKYSRGASVCQNMTSSTSWYQW
jgi:hypothetical protein